mmetsp:Transcript_22532/g.32928  ORF Transcript_22532/g.32928 Transcript_22532/m.32928 type:complete len:263 (-) Transcript_22532:98-886(-)
MTSSAPRDASYFDCDFDFDEWRVQCAERPLPLIKPLDNCDEEQYSRWNNFYQSHVTGNFFKPRKYLSVEFEKWLSGQSACVLEVGCGYGCSIFPLLDRFPDLSFIATDYSHDALQIFAGNKKFDSSRIQVEKWDITKTHTFSASPVNAVLMIFALSAVHPDDHISAMENVHNILNVGGVVLFRDYGIFDMTMLRHETRRGENLYERADGTLSYYFDIEYVSDLCLQCGFTPLELKYATVINRNRKKGIEMRRVFVHGVFKKL